MSAPSRLRPALLLAVLASAALSPLTVGAQELRLTAENRRSLILTVYNQNLGLVSETRRVELPAGETVLAIADVRSQLQPETALLGAPGLRVIEQTLAGDLRTPPRLREATLGETVQHIHPPPWTGADVVAAERVSSL